MVGNIIQERWHVFLISLIILNTHLRNQREWNSDQTINIYKILHIFKRILHRTINYLKKKTIWAETLYHSHVLPLVLSPISPHPEPHIPHHEPHIPHHEPHHPPHPEHHIPHPEPHISHPEPHNSHPEPHITPPWILYPPPWTSYPPTLNLISPPWTSYPPPWTSYPHPEPHITPPWTSYHSILNLISPTLNLISPPWTLYPSTLNLISLHPEPNLPPPWTLYPSTLNLISPVLRVTLSSHMFPYTAFLSWSALTPSANVLPSPHWQIDHIQNILTPPFMTNGLIQLWQSYVKKMANFTELGVDHVIFVEGGITGVIF